MKKKRLDRDLKWGFHHFPYYQMRVDIDGFHGIVCLIQLVDGDTIYWNLPISGKTAVAGAGMTWLQMIPDGQQRLITAKYLPDKTVSVWYVDVIDGYTYDHDGVVVYTDKYLDVYFTPQGDLVIDDRDELDAAFQSEELSKAQYDDALRECESILDELCRNIPATTALCRHVLDTVEARIFAGEKPFKK